MAAEVEEQHSEDICRSDKLTIILLLFLYFLQGLPIGLLMSIQLILQKNVSYKEQAMFSIVGWPYSLKLLWAPIVDSLYWKYMGRRKTWLIFTQYLLGFFMLILSTYVPTFFGDINDSPNVLGLTIAFFCIVFLCATQDITVDGWALTMLSRKNVGFAAVCNTVGLRAGMFFGNVIFLLLESPDFCNQYLRSFPQTEGFITLAGFLRFTGITFCFATTAVLVFQSESEEKHEEILGLKDTCKQLYHVLCLKNVLLLIFFLMTFQICNAAVDSVSKLKFMEAGVQKETIALLEIPLVPIEILFPLYISRHTTGINPLNVFLKAFPYKLICSILFALLVWWTYYVKLDSGAFPSSYYILLLMLLIIHQIPHISIFVSVGSFLNKVSDPTIGGTYMTMLNTFYNLGKHWAHTLALWFVDVLTLKTCDNPMFSCGNKKESLKCTSAGHKCITILDGYYIETVACVIFGLLWLRWGRRVIFKLQNSIASEWRIVQHTPLINLESVKI